eukprot:8080793-Heterocapsa_arctica.AAC.1
MIKCLVKRVEEVANHEGFYDIELGSSNRFSGGIDSLDSAVMGGNLVILVLGEDILSLKQEVFDSRTTEKEKNAEAVEDAKAMWVA